VVQKLRREPALPSLSRKLVAPYVADRDPVRTPLPRQLRLLVEIGEMSRKHPSNGIHKQFGVEIPENIA
jgi:hypothetical protein